MKLQIDTIVVVQKNPDTGEKILKLVTKQRLPFFQTLLKPDFLCVPDKKAISQIHDLTLDEVIVIPVSTAVETPPTNVSHGTNNGSESDFSKFIDGLISSIDTKDAPAMLPKVPAKAATKNVRSEIANVETNENTGGVDNKADEIVIDDSDGEGEKESTEPSYDSDIESKRTEPESDPEASDEEILEVTPSKIKNLSLIPKVLPNDEQLSNEHKNRAKDKLLKNQFNLAVSKNNNDSDIEDTQDEIQIDMEPDSDPNKSDDEDGSNSAGGETNYNKSHYVRDTSKNNNSDHTKQNHSMSKKDGATKKKEIDEAKKPATRMILINGKLYDSALLFPSENEESMGEKLEDLLTQKVAKSIKDIKEATDEDVQGDSKVIAEQCPNEDDVEVIEEAHEPAAEDMSQKLPKTSECKANDLENENIVSDNSDKKEKEPTAKGGSQKLNEESKKRRKVDIKNNQNNQNSERNAKKIKTECETENPNNDNHNESSGSHGRNNLSDPMPEKKSEGFQGNLKECVLPTEKSELKEEGAIEGKCVGDNDKESISMDINITYGKCMMSHRRKCKTKLELKVVCEFCGSRFGSKKELKKHLVISKHKTDERLPKAGTPEWFSVVNRSENFLPSLKCFIISSGLSSREHKREKDTDKISHTNNTADEKSNNKESETKISTIEQESENPSDVKGTSDITEDNDDPLQDEAKCVEDENGLEDEKENDSNMNAIDIEIKKEKIDIEYGLEAEEISNSSESISETNESTDDNGRKEEKINEMIAQNISNAKDLVKLLPKEVNETKNEKSINIKKERYENSQEKADTDESKSSQTIEIQVDGNDKTNDTINDSPKQDIKSENRGSKLLDELKKRKENTFACEICSFKFLTQSGLDKHSEKEHYTIKEEPQDPPDDDDIIVQAVSSNKEVEDIDKDADTDKIDEPSNIGDSVTINDLAKTIDMVPKKKDSPIKPDANKAQDQEQNRKEYKDVQHKELPIKNNKNPIVPAKIKCNKCDSNYSSLALLSVHMRFDHKESIIASSKIEAKKQALMNTLSKDKQNDNQNIDIIQKKPETANNNNGNSTTRSDNAHLQIDRKESIIASKLEAKKVALMNAVSKEKQNITQNVDNIQKKPETINNNNGNSTTRSDNAQMRIDRKESIIANSKIEAKKQALMNPASKEKQNVIQNIDIVQKKPETTNNNNTSSTTRSDKEVGAKGKEIAAPKVVSKLKSDSHISLNSGKIEPKDIKKSNSLLEKVGSGPANISKTSGNIKKPVPIKLPVSTPMSKPDISLGNTLKQKDKNLEARPINLTQIISEEKLNKVLKETFVLKTDRTETKPRPVSFKPLSNVTNKNNLEITIKNKPEKILVPTKQSTNYNTLKKKIDDRLIEIKKANDDLLSKNTANHFRKIDGVTISRLDQSDHKELKKVEKRVTFGNPAPNIKPAAVVKKAVADTSDKYDSKAFLRFQTDEIKKLKANGKIKLFNGNVDLITEMLKRKWNALALNDKLKFNDTKKESTGPIKSISNKVFRPY